LRGLWAIQANQQTSAAEGPYAAGARLLPHKSEQLELPMSRNVKVPKQLILLAPVGF
jgi:hypothetical protein